MKKFVTAFAAGVATVFGLFAETYKVATSEELVTAVANAGAGDEIVLAANTYSLDGTLAVGEAITVRGATGDWKDVIIRGSGAAEERVIYIQNATLESVTVTNGRVPYDGTGGGIYLDGGTVRNCRLTDNQSGGNNRGGIAIANNGGTVVDCLIDGNTHSGGNCRGLAYVQWNGAIGERLVITNNVNTGALHGSDGNWRQGGGACVYGGTLRNSLIAFNRAGTYGSAGGTQNTGIGVTITDGTLENCTIYGNTYDGVANGIFAGVGRTGGTVRNCLISANAGSAGEQNWVGSPSSFVTCCTSPVDGLADASLADETTLVFDRGVARLIRGSSAINAATDPGTYGEDAIDLYGNLRIRDGLDIGCVEYVEPSFGCVFTADRTSGLGEYVVTLVAHPEGNLDGLNCTWSFSDGSADIVGTSEITHRISAIGMTTVTLVARNRWGGSETWTQTFTMQPKTHYVKKGNPGAEAPYASIATAAADIPTAVAAAVEGAEVVVLPPDDGSMYVLSSTLTIAKGVTIRGSTGDWKDVVISRGGGNRAIDVKSAAFRLESVTVRDGMVNEGDGAGGGLRMFYGGTVTNCRITACSVNGARRQGIGIYNNGGTVVDTVIDNCTGKDYFRGIAYYQSGASALMDRCVITNNAATTLCNGDRGWTLGVVSLNGGVIRNTLIARNSLGSVGSEPNTSIPVPLAVRQQGGTLRECTIVDNTYESFGSLADYARGVWLSGGNVVNCIIGNNGQSATRVQNWTGSAASYKNCCVYPVDAGMSNPQEFTAGTVAYGSDGRIRLLNGSGAVGNALVDGTYGEGAVDIYGNPRMVDGKQDIGCVQYVAPAFACTFTWDVASGLDSFTATLTAHPDGDLEGLDYVWSFSDGSPDVAGGDKAVITHTFSTYGETTVTLTARNAAGNEATQSQVFTVQPSRHYVRQGNPGADGYFIDEATAAASIEDAVAIAFEGAEIVILPNDDGSAYSVAKTISIAKNITLRGSTGNRDDIVLDGANAVRVLSVTARGGFALRDLTVARGYVPEGDGAGGGVALHYGGIVSNCHITACTVGGWRRQGVGLYNSGGTVVDCLIDNNVGSGYYRGIGYCQTGSGALMDRCIVTGNVAKTTCCGDPGWSLGAGAWIGGGTIRNTLVAWNSAGDAGSELGASNPITVGVYFAGRQMVNCTIIGNTYGDGGSKEGDCWGLRNAGGSYVNSLIADNGCTNGVVYNVKNGFTSQFAACSELSNAYRMSRGRFVLSPASALVDAGTLELCDVGPLDVYGHPRIHGKKGVDIGAVECQDSYGLMLILK